MQDFLRALLENTEEAVAACDAQGTLAFFSPALRELTGLAPEPLPFKEWARRYRAYYPGGQRLMAADDLPLVRAWREERVRHAELVLKTPKGEDRTLLANAGPVHAADGRLLGAVVSLRDVTGVRQAQKLAALGQEVARGMAQDFNNYLTVIGGYADVLLDRLGPDDLLREIKRACEGAATLTRQVLALSRRQAVAAKPVDLNAVVAESVGLIRGVVGGRVQVSAALQPGLGGVRADPSQLQQVLLNLAANGRDVMPGGGQLTIATEAIGDTVLLTVADTGHGMSPDGRAHLFEPFFTTKGEQGTGLGLTIVRAIVQQAGGRMEVRTEVGRGTTFQVYLPRYH